MTKVKGKLLVVLSMFLALLLTVASLGTFSAKADAKVYPDTSKLENLMKDGSYTGKLAGENGLYYEFSMTLGTSGEAQLYTLYTNSTELKVKIVYNNPEKSSGGTTIDGVGIVVGVMPILQGNETMLDCWVNNDCTAVIVYIPTGLNLDAEGKVTESAPTWTSDDATFDASNLLSGTTLLGVYETLEIEEDGASEEPTLKDKWNEFTSDIADLFNENTGLAVSSSIVSIVIVGAILYLFLGPRRRR